MKMDSDKQPVSRHLSYPNQSVKSDDDATKMDSGKQPASGKLSDDKQQMQVTKSDGDEVKMGSRKQVKHANKRGIDEAAATWSTVNDDCILFGRGKGANDHKANKRMRAIVDKHRDEYIFAGRGEKRKLVLAVHQELVEAGMKFLKQQNGKDGWVEADTDEAIKKVGHALRCHRSRSKSETEPIDESSNVASRISAAMHPHDSVNCQVLQNTSSRDVGENLTGLPALPSMSTAGSAGLLSSVTSGSQVVLGSGLLTLSNPLLSLGRLPMPMNLVSLYPNVSAPMGLAMPAASLSGLSSVDLCVMIDRERQLRQAMLYSDILRYTKQR